MRRYHRTTEGRGSNKTMTNPRRRRVTGWVQRNGNCGRFDTPYVDPYLQQHAEARAKHQQSRKLFRVFRGTFGISTAPNACPQYFALLVHCGLLVVGDDRHRPFPLSVQKKLFCQPDGLDCRFACMGTVDRSQRWI